MVAIGTSDLDIFPLALGGNTFGWTSDEDTSFDILDAFTAGGGNFVDTADSYSAFADGNSGGESETIIGKWMTARGNRDDVVLATKVSQHPEFRGLAPDNIRAAADASLARLQTDHIDVYYAHYDDDKTPLVESLAAFDDLVRAGKVRHVAISNYSPARVREWLGLAKENGFAAPIALQPHYNLVARRDYEGELQALAVDNGLGVFPYFSLAAGFLTGKYRTREDLAGTQRERLTTGYFSDAGLAVVQGLQEIADSRSAELSSVALAWLLARPGITAPIASASSLAQVPALLDAPTLRLTSHEVDTLTGLSDAVA
ncbi:aldo/keto reductase [Rhodococcus fascians]|uniref:aldo/keto reductase n=1 Tax=Rhodococcoides fascians TaxID=1828 RepID=UPI00050C67E7|nr:aldo/keto reductase [Rhodococcus fascians]MBY3790932.1 aldo/keto reductase [Rhodococcus fascians]MBY3823628.1 aldo/keto reductase [Rhodococcus fascians]MBY3834150.1 aldo/keto reductase [Rhodococcus fascians]MBY3863363.1 aldo/keto reductase [Rhodococcus fascians]MBY3882833.1 aldo/keto reductase [Rhodococcus fascians]